MAIDSHRDSKHHVNVDAVNLKYKRIPESGNTVIVKTLMQKNRRAQASSLKKNIPFSWSLSLTTLSTVTIQ